MEEIFERIKGAGIRLNANHARDLEELLTEIAGRDGLSLLETVGDPAVASLLDDPSLNGPKKLARLKEVLYQRRYPTYALIKKVFDDELKRLKLSSRIKVTPTPFFEDTKLMIEFTYETPAQLREINESLARLAQAELVENALRSAQVTD